MFFFIVTLLQLSSCHKHYQFFLLKGTDSHGILLNSVSRTGSTLFSSFFQELWVFKKWFYFFKSIFCLFQLPYMIHFYYHLLYHFYIFNNTEHLFTKYTMYVFECLRKYLCCKVFSFIIDTVATHFSSWLTVSRDLQSPRPLLRESLPAKNAKF